MAEPRRVLYCLNGLGYFGTRSLRTALQLIPHLAGQPTPTAVTIFALCDPLQAARAAALDGMAAINFETSGILLGDNLDSLILFIRRRIADTKDPLGPDDKILIHDCSPTDTHANNVRSIAKHLDAVPALRDHLVYLVEKPAATSLQVNSELDLQPIIPVAKRRIQPLPEGMYCDYIELQSRTFLAARAWLDEHKDFSPTHLFVWRNSGTGYKKVFEGGRGGVTGGALEDKSAHDLALTIGLLGMPDKPVKVTSARLENYLPAMWSQDDNPTPSFRTIDDLSVQALDGRYNGGESTLAFNLADARICAGLRWNVNAKDVHCRYSFAWDGVDPKLVSHLANWRVPRSLFVGSEWRTGRGGRDRYLLEEARIHILEDRRSSLKRSLILNFLTKFREVEAWVYYCVEGHEPKIVELPPAPGGDNSLFRVLCSLATGTPDEFGEPSTSLILRLTHGIRLQASRREAPDERSAMAATIQAFTRRSSLEQIGRYAGVVFDLDNTLLDTMNIDESLLAPVLERLKQAGRRSDRWIALARERLTRMSLEEIDAGRELGLSEDEREALWTGFRELRVRRGMKLELYEDARSVLKSLHGRRPPPRMALLTKGFRQLQLSKVEHLGLRTYFGDDVYVDNLEEGEGRLGQAEYLRYILSRWEVQPERVLVVGDRAAAELQAGLSLGLDTVLLLREGQATPQESIHRVVRNLYEVGNLLQGE